MYQIEYVYMNLFINTHNFVRVENKNLEVLNNFFEVKKLAQQIKTVILGVFKNMVLFKTIFLGTFLRTYNTIA